MAFLSLTARILIQMIQNSFPAWRHDWETLCANLMRFCAAVWAKHSLKENSERDRIPAKPILTTPPECGVVITRTRPVEDIQSGDSAGIRTHDLPIMRPTLFHCTTASPCAYSTVQITLRHTLLPFCGFEEWWLTFIALVCLQRITICLQVLIHVPLSPLSKGLNPISNLRFFRYHLCEGPQWLTFWCGKNVLHSRANFQFH